MYYIHLEIQKHFHRRRPFKIIFSALSLQQLPPLKLQNSSQVASKLLLAKTILQGIRLQ